MATKAPKNDTRPAAFRRSELLKRIHKFLVGIELAVTALTVQPHLLSRKAMPNGETCWEFRIRWWAPAHWVGWVRVVVFRDECGSAFYSANPNGAARRNGESTA